jgi:hypothetical protein
MKCREISSLLSFVVYAPTKRRETGSLPSFVVSMPDEAQEDWLTPLDRRVDAPTKRRETDSRSWRRSRRKK